MSESTIQGDVVSTRFGISWSAVWAGAVVAAAIAVTLTLLGAGFGFSSVSVHHRQNPSIGTFTAVAAVWLIIVQWVSSFFGGYLAGRLRPSLSGIQASEVTFRDTAAGLTTWAVAAVLTAVVASSGISGLLKDAGTIAQHSEMVAHPDAYVLDVLLRPAQPPVGPTAPNFMGRMEAERILMTGANGPLSPADDGYLVQMVQNDAGVSADDAVQRVDHALAAEQAAVAKAKQVAEAARKSTADLAFFTCFSMMVGAFIAAAAGAIGGRQRDKL